LARVRNLRPEESNATTLTKTSSKQQRDDEERTEFGVSWPRDCSSRRRNLEESPFVLLHPKKSSQNTTQERCHSLPRRSIARVGLLRRLRTPAGTRPRQETKFLEHHRISTATYVLERYRANVNSADPLRNKNCAKWRTARLVDALSERQSCTHGCGMKSN
jgi:hypothetical protein